MYVFRQAHGSSAQSVPIDTVTTETAQKPQFQIINLCAEIPTQLNQLVNSFVEAPATANLTDEVKSFSDVIEAEANRLRQYVDTYYSTMLSAADPYANTIKELMSSSINDLLTSVQQIGDNLGTEITQTADNGNDVIRSRIQYVEQYVRPAIESFQNSCISQTTDILQNAMNDLQKAIVQEGTQGVRNGITQGGQVLRSSIPF